MWPYLGQWHLGSPRSGLQEEESKNEDRHITFHHVPAAFPLTHVVCDDGERLQVGFPDILSQGVGVVFKVAEQVGSTTFGLLDLIPVLLVGRIQ